MRIVRKGVRTPVSYTTQDHFNFVVAQPLVIMIALPYFQVRTQEEIMNECQVWWTLTGQFGNILPIDWSKTYTRHIFIERQIT